ncbi:MAG: hypothetical protein IJ574_05820 [Bacilli bacterium]|nr:hypothetical protein [Bacilli bacterium]
MTETAELCNNAAPFLKIIGVVLLVVKIAVPIILLLTGAIAYGSAVISNDEKAMKGATSKLISKIIAAIVIFLLPYLLNTLFNLIDDYAQLGKSYKACWNCVLKPDTCPKTETVSN